MTIPQYGSRKEIFGWAMYDFANSGYTTVVLTAIFNAYFVGVIAGELENGDATLLWTVIVGIANGLIILSAPLVGAVADFSAAKKKFLALATLGCVLSTASLALLGPGDMLLAACLVIASCVTFYSGENLVAAFLPEISPPQEMGRISAFGWTLGYVGGLIVLGACLLYVTFAEGRGDPPESYVPVTMLIVAAAFGLASLPTFLWVKERATPHAHGAHVDYLKVGFSRLGTTFHHARHYRDLFRFFLSLTIIYCGINTVIILAAVYAQEVMGFGTSDAIILILVVNVTAAIGAFVFGWLQDRIGSLTTIKLTLIIWITALIIAFLSDQRPSFWVAANLIGIALGSSQSAGRAVVGLFSPAERSGEFFGLWGLATKASAIIGPISYGLIAQFTHGDHRQALLSTCFFFVAGFLSLFWIDEQRGREAAGEAFE